jgi:cytochrome P450
VIGNAHSLHFDPEYYPSPSKFDPERFLDPATAADAKANMRTFNRGPRACMGQNLAVDELRLILLMTVRDYEFECVGLKPNAKPRVSWWDLDTTFGDICFQQLGLAAEVRGGMMMKVKRVEGR